MQDLGTSYAVKAQSQHTLVSRALLLILALMNMLIFAFYHPWKSLSFLLLFLQMFLHCVNLELVHVTEDHADRRISSILHVKWLVLEHDLDLYCLSL